MDYITRARALHLFAGAGGGILGGDLLNWRTVCAVEIDPFCREVLVARQNDGTLDPFPIWDDVRTFDGRPWRGCCDIVCGGFPCQNVSPLGDRSGIRGEQSCLWCEMARIIGEVRPGFAFIENSSDLIKLGLDVVLRDLAEIGYDAEWTCLSAAECGAPHVRDRLWLLAKRITPEIPGGAGEDAGYSVEDIRWIGGEDTRTELHVLADSYAQRREKQRVPGTTPEEVRSAELQGEDTGGRYVGCKWWAGEPGVRRVADGVADVVDRLGALGNGQVPYVAARAFSELYTRFGK